MLKHKEIIDKLTKEQKIALVTDTRDGYGGALEEYKIPTTSLNDLWAENKGEDGDCLFPSPKSLANSWDTRLFGEVAKCLASIGAGRGDNLFILPSTNAASSVYGRELSEEPHLSGSLVASAAKKLKEAGIPYCLKEPVCTSDDARFLDKEANISVLYDRYARPFKLARDVGGACAMVRSDEEDEGTYKDAVQRLLNEVVPANMDKLIKIEDGDMTVTALVRGDQLIGGSSLVLTTALENYERIYRSMEEGGATAQELNMTLSDGAAISEEILDAALDKKLELAYRCNTPCVRATQSEIEETAYLAAKKSIVLVKNSNRTLPLKKNEKLSIVGDIISDGEGSNYRCFAEKFGQGMAAYRCSVTGFERGYDIAQSVSPELIEPACQQSSGAGVTVAFVGLGAAREDALVQKPHLALPGNQIAMLTRLRKSSKRLIVVICGECLPDMSFDIMADAILLVPPKGAYVAQALCDILGGAFSPCGKLAYAGYSNVDTVVREIQKRKSLGKQKIGPFVGYRYADSNGEWTKYPFGFGLSYTSFEYSRLSVDNQGNVSFSVKNTGKLSGGDAVQIYVGMPSSNKIRARKELKGFSQVDLKPGQKIRVTVSLGALDIYDRERDKAVIEAGGYDIHVCSCANDARISRRLNLIGANLNKEDERLSDYLQNVSNIVSESYTMEAYCKPMNTKSKLKSFGLILLLTTLFADVVYVISGLMGYFDPLDSLYLIVCLITNGACVLCSIIAMAVGGMASKKAKKALEKQELEATKELFKTVKPADVSAIDRLFEDEFDMSLEPSHKKEVVLDDNDDSVYAYMAVDTDIPNLCKELLAHFAEYGVVITPKMSRRLLSSIMTSRLLIVRNTMGISCDRIVEILARFFGTAPHTEKIGGAKWDRVSMLRYNDQTTLDGTSRTAPLMQAINSAQSEGDKACFYGVEGARFEDVGNMLMPYVQYFGNPEIEHVIVDGHDTVTMPTNLWFVVTPSAEQSLDDLPAFVANLATVVDLEGQTKAETVNKTLRKFVTCHQLDALIFRAKKKADIDENVWKGVDTLEAFVREKTPYHIGNKLFLQLERYMAVYSTCEEDLHEAMDCAVAGKLIPGILNILKGNEGMHDTDLAQIVESIFGEEYSIACTNTIKRLVLGKGGKENAESKMQNAELNSSVAEATENVTEGEKSVAEGAELRDAEGVVPYGSTFEKAEEVKSEEAEAQGESK